MSIDIESNFIKIEFFDRFGDINKLIWIAELFDEIYNKKSIKKDSEIIGLITEEIIISSAI